MGRRSPAESFFTVIFEHAPLRAARSNLSCCRADDGRLQRGLSCSAAAFSRCCGSVGVLLGKPERVPGVAYLKARVWTHLVARVPVQVDGDMGGSCRCVFEVLPRAVGFCVAPVAD